MDKLVSIAMATYNGEKYLREQLDSIYAQSYKNLEVIVCDDCSNDKTVEILEDYAKKYGLKYYINEKNLGYVKNFEKAISLCNGDYIALADQDDIWLPEKIQVLVENIGDKSVIHSDAYLINESGTVFSNSYTDFSKKMIKPNSEIDMILNGCVTGCTSMFKKHFINKILPFPDKLYVHDKYIGFSAFLENSLVYIDRPLIKYRQHFANNIGAINVNINIINKIINKDFNRNKKNNSFSKFKIQYENQKNFCEIVINQYINKLTQLDEINRLYRFYENIILLQNIYSIFREYIHFFSNIEKNKPLKYRLFVFVAFMINILSFKLKKIK